MHQSVYGKETPSVEPCSSGRADTERPRISEVPPRCVPGCGALRGPMDTSAPESNYSLKQSMGGYALEVSYGYSLHMHTPYLFYIRSIVSHVGNGGIIMPANLPWAWRCVSDQIDWPSLREIRGDR